MRLLCHMCYYCSYVFIDISNTVIPLIFFSCQLVILGHKWSNDVGFWFDTLCFRALESQYQIIPNASTSVLAITQLLERKQTFLFCRLIYFFRHISVKSNNTNDKYYSQVQLMSLPSLSGSVLCCLLTY